MKKIISIIGVMALVISCKMLDSDTKKFDNSNEQTITLENLLASPVGKRLSDRSVCAQDALAAKKVLVLGQSQPGMEGNAEAVCSQQNGSNLCKQRGYTTTGWGFELPKAGIDIGQTASSVCYFVSKLLGSDAKPRGFEDATYSLHQVKVKQLIRDYQQTQDAYLVRVNSLNKIDRTKSVHLIYFSEDGKLIGFGDRVTPGRNYNADGAIDAPEAETHIVY